MKQKSIIATAKAPAFIDRRTSPHYVVNSPALLKVRQDGQWENFDVELIDISIIGSRIASKSQLPVVKDCVLEIKPLSGAHNLIMLPASTEESKSTNGKFHYVLKFEKTDDTQCDNLKSFLCGLTPVIDRRIKQRRDDAAPSKFERRVFDRRLTQEFFIKCLRYNRMEKLIEKDQYFYLREFQSSPARVVTVKGKELLMLGSNNYLGLATHPKVMEAAVKAIEKYGTGVCGSRVINGNIDLHAQLEAVITKHKKMEDCIVYSTGFMANLGAITALLDKGDTAIIDAKCHASIIDGCHLTGVELVPFKHNDMDDLAVKLKKFGASAGRKLLITEGVFSMDGDIAKLDEIYRLASSYGIPIMVDDAHGTGVLGEHGRGTVEYYGLEGKIDVIMGTFSKTLAGVGGFIAASKKIIHYLQHNSRPFIFTAGLPASVCAATIAGFDVIEAEPELRANLWRNVDFLKKNLSDMGYNIGACNSAVIPILVEDEIKTYRLAGMLERLGIFVNPIAYPAVRKRESRIRVSAMATHGIPELERAVECFRAAGKELGVI
jgi:8-amino-7-oxononanoate synthase